MQQTLLTTTTLHPFINSFPTPIIHKYQDDLGDDEVLSALGEMIALDNDEGNNARKSAEAKKESRMKLESILVSKMARDSYNLIVKTINCATDMGLRSYHLLSKDLPTTEAAHSPIIEVSGARIRRGLNAISKLSLAQKAINSCHQRPIDQRLRQGKNQIARAKYL